MHIAVIGAGVFGGWTALHLLERGAHVTLVDRWGPGNSQSSSGGETRIIRSVYGSDDSSTRLAIRSLELWKEYERRWNIRLFHRTGMLFFADEADEFLAASQSARCERTTALEQLSIAEASRRYPQVAFDGIGSVLYDADAGILTARENCRAVMSHFVQQGGNFIQAAVSAQPLQGELEIIALSDGTQVKADQFVFACGPWLPQLFPDVVGDLVRPTRQDVIFVAVPPGDSRFSAESFPCWADSTSRSKFYGIPDFQQRGFKIASDLRGPSFDPDTQDRVIDPDSWTHVKAYLKIRFPALSSAPLVETRVCQYENTPDLGFIIDRHPAAHNVLLAGGGSGHGYKHGPAIGELIANAMLNDTPPGPVFALNRFGPATRRPLASF